MSGSDGQSNGQGHSILVVRPAGIADALHNKDQDECDECLNDNRLSDGDQRIDASHAQIADERGGSCDLKVTSRNVDCCRHGNIYEYIY